MMQPRDIGSELLVAVAAVAILVFALIFGVLLSLSSNPMVATQTPVAVVDASVTSALETVTTATETPTLTPSDTPITADPTEKATETATEAKMEIEASLTITPSATDTNIPPTLTSTLTKTARATATLKVIRTPTKIEPTLSATPVAVTPTLSATETPYATETSGIRPTPTPTDTPDVSPVVCVRPPGWATYVVEAGNTLFSIGLAVGSTVRELTAVNCLANPDQITAGDVLFVPRLPVEPVATGTSYTGGGVIGCQAPQIAALTNLRAGQRINSPITLRGTATLPDFWYYKIEVRPEASNEYNFYLRAEQPVTQGDLGVLNPAIFGRGRHWVRLVVVALDASVTDMAVCVVPVFFE